ncbi:MAG: phage portal protein [Prevotellaceae bacterium]|jgi:hypothetical protein|nr:phage portal protein [Prevotellaceae bacterium]
MAFFGINSKSKKKDKDCGQAEHPKTWWYPITMSGRGVFYGHNYFKAYQYISQVRTVIDKRAKCLAVAVPYILDKDGNEPKSAEEFRRLFKTPNFIQSFSELYVLKEIYRLIYGWSVIYLARAFPGATPFAMFVIPPPLLNFQLSRDYLVYNQKDETNIVNKISLSGTKVEIEFSDLIFFRDSIPDACNPLISESVMMSIFNEYDLAGAINESEKTIVERQGAIGILSKDLNDQIATGLFEDEREMLQQKYKETYGLKMNKDQIIITEMALKWQAMSFPTRDLMLIELGEEAQKRIAGVYDVPYNLLPGGSNSTFSNQHEAIEYLYNANAIPTSKSDAEKFTAAILEKHGLHLKLDYSDLYVFQKNEKERANAMNIAINALNAAFTAGNITQEEWRLEASRYLNIDPNKKLQS